MYTYISLKWRVCTHTFKNHLRLNNIRSRFIIASSMDNNQVNIKYCYCKTVMQNIVNRLPTVRVNYCGALNCNYCMSCGLCGILIGQCKEVNIKERHLQWLSALVLNTGSKDTVNCRHVSCYIQYDNTNEEWGQVTDHKFNIPFLPTQHNTTQHYFSKMEKGKQFRVYHNFFN